MPDGSPARREPRYLCTAVTEEEWAAFQERRKRARLQLHEIFGEDYEGVNKDQMHARGRCGSTFASVEKRPTHKPARGLWLH